MGQIGIRTTTENTVTGRLAGSGARSTSRISDSGETAKKRRQTVYLNAT
jgi:hypothetical protein